MAIGTIYKLDQIVLASGQDIQAAGQQKWGYGIKTLIERDAGTVWPMFYANEEQKPQFDFTTKSIDVLLTNCGIGGNGALTNITTWLKQATSTGNASRTGTVHQKAQISEALLYWTSIKLPHNKPAEAQCMLVCIFDGTNDPFVYTGSVALTGSLIPQNYFGGGPVEINGTVVPGVQETTIESGIKLVQLGSASDEFDTFVGIEMGEPSITLKTFQTVNWQTLGLRGIALDGEDGIVTYGRQYLAGGSRVPNATATHIKFVGLNGQCVPIDTTGNESGPVTDTLKVHLNVLTDAGSPLTVTVGSAIT